MKKEYRQEVFEKQFSQFDADVPPLFPQIDYDINKILEEIENKFKKDLHI